MHINILSKINFVYFLVLFSLTTTLTLQAEIPFTPSPWSSTKSRIDFYVSWEISSSNFPTEGIAIQSESYRELWSLRVAGESGSLLISPHGIAKVIIYPLGKPDNLPIMLVLSNTEFAKIVGVPTLIILPVDNTLHDLVMIVFGTNSHSLQEFTLQMSKTNFYNINLSMSR